MGAEDCVLRCKGEVVGLLSPSHTFLSQLKNEQMIGECEKCQTLKLWESVVRQQHAL